MRHFATVLKEAQTSVLSSFSLASRQNSFSSASVFEGRMIFSLSRMSGVEGSYHCQVLVYSCRAPFGIKWTRRAESTSCFRTVTCRNFRDVLRFSFQRSSFHLCEHHVLQAATAIGVSVRGTREAQLIFFRGFSGGGGRIEFSRNFFCQTRATKSPGSAS